MENIKEFDEFIGEGSLMDKYPPIVEKRKLKKATQPVWDIIHKTSKLNTIAHKLTLELNSPNTKFEKLKKIIDEDYLMMLNDIKNLFDTIDFSDYIKK